MAQDKPEEDARTQREKSLEAARELGARQSEAIFRRALEKTAKARRAMAKKVVPKSK